uniref:Uncharacterized protein n=1 Tax=Micrurus lemniscatus lemniscatus TaxID=129467 RepID=A0A2D4HV33_MICLE
MRVLAIIPLSQNGPPGIWVEQILLVNYIFSDPWLTVLIDGTTLPPPFKTLNTFKYIFKFTTTVKNRSKNISFVSLLSVLENKILKKVPFPFLLLPSPKSHPYKG